MYGKEQVGNDHEKTQSERKKKLNKFLNVNKNKTEIL